MSIQIQEVTTDKHRKQFVDFQFKLYKNDPYWVPQLKKDEISGIDPTKNPAFKFCEAKFWLALKNGEIVGRIGAIINSLIIEKTGENILRFTRPEFIDDEEVANALFDTVKNYALAKKMDGINGPLGFSNLDHQGLLIEGHDWLPSVASDFHKAYYKKHYERLGFEKEIDWLEFRLTFPDKLPDKAKRVAQMVKKRYSMESLSFKTKEDLSEIKEPVFSVFNDAFRDLYGTFEFPDYYVRYNIEKFFPMLNPDLVHVLQDNDGEMAAFIVGIPSLSKAMRKAKGKLFPLGWYYLSRALKKPKEMDLVLTGVKKEYQSLGLISILMNDLWQAANLYGIRFVETTAMLENNHIAIQLWKSFDHIQHKRKRCYKYTF